VPNFKKKIRDESKRRTVESHQSPVANLESDRSTRTGKITIQNMSVENLNAWSKKALYVLFQVESNSCAHTKGPHSWEKWIFETDVSDVLTDVVVCVFPNRPVGSILGVEDVLVGKAILPLANVLAADDNVSMFGTC